MRPGSLKDRVQDGATALGAWISLREPLLAEAAGLAGYDYVVIDMQHGLSDYGEVVPMLQAICRTPTVPLVRVPWNEPGIIGRVLDAGALGRDHPDDQLRRRRAACGRGVPLRAGRGAQHRSARHADALRGGLPRHGQRASSPASR